MAVIITTDKPRTLLAAIKEAIDNSDIETWSYDADGDFTHTSVQWKRRAWLRPSISEESLVFRIIPPRKQNITRVVYGIYHGRFIEMLLNHFDSEFTEASATALPSKGDRTRGADSGR